MQVNGTSHSDLKDLLLLMQLKNGQLLTLDYRAIVLIGEKSAFAHIDIREIKQVVYGKEEVQIHHQKVSASEESASEVVELRMDKQQQQLFKKSLWEATGNFRKPKN